MESQEDMGELRYPGCHLGEQGQKVTRTTDCPFPVPSEGHKATLLSTEKAECAMVKSVKEKGVHGPGRLLSPSNWTQHLVSNPGGTERIVPSGRNRS